MIGVRSLEKEYHVGDHVVRALRGVTLDIAGGEFVVAGLAAENPNLDWLLPESGGIRWMQAIGLFDDRRRQAPPLLARQQCVLINQR